MVNTSTALFWFRRDLRLNDNAGLYYALKENTQVQAIFIFDTDILEKLEDKNDRRVCFIHEQIEHLQRELLLMQSSIKVFVGKPIDIFKELSSQYNINKVYTNHDYEPYANARDRAVEEYLKTKNISFHTYKDQVIFETNEVVKDDGKPYTVFTPYSKKWKSKLNDFYIKPYPTQKYFNHFSKSEKITLPSLNEIGFNSVGTKFPTPNLNLHVIQNYKEHRDYPAINGTSKISVHLRFGTLSIRALVLEALKHNETWLNELIWREFYMMILHHFPHVVDRAFKPNYDLIAWSNNQKHYELWCQGKTGYPIVDAGMRELNQTGFMHNRVRMITASFLTKHLLIDWRWGEAYFASKLLDFELSSNNGGWQWSASSGCDAAPYFRVFNPYEQTKKFDPQLKYIKQWIPEYDELTYLKPIVDHKMARERVLKTFKEALGNQ
jgi:deoxyribodipyrimidine photo-lyase